ncbi:MAG: phospholipase family protein [Nitrospirae bacterium]|nr:phospholipase family protein [Nitrospirota bacterium]
MRSEQMNASFSTDAIAQAYGIPFTDGNRVTLLWKGHDSFRKIFDAVEKAKELICLEFYIFRNDETGNELAKILKTKALNGVTVSILYDHFGSLGTPMTFWRDMRKAGVQIRASRPFKWTDPFHYVHRDHKKLLIIDGVIAFTGGLNIANEYRGYHRVRNIKGWRDTGIFLEGPVAKTLLEIFKKSWQVWKGPAIHFDQSTEPVDGGVPVLPIFVNSAKGRRKMRKLLYYSISQARTDICLTTAYFTPSRRMLHVLEEAEARGVDVKLLLPGKSDVTAAHYAGRAFFAKLLKAGVEIYTYQGEILHAKTAVFDGVWSVIGSTNLDFQSLRKNDEGNVGIIDADFGKQMQRVFEEDLQQSKQITIDAWSKRSLWEKVKEQFFSLFRRRL